MKFCSLGLPKTKHPASRADPCSYTHVCSNRIPGFVMHGTLLWYSESVRPDFVLGLHWSHENEKAQAKASSRLCIDLGKLICRLEGTFRIYDTNSCRIGTKKRTIMVFFPVSCTTDIVQSLCRTSVCLNIYKGLTGRLIPFHTYRQRLNSDTHFLSTNMKLSILFAGLVSAQIPAFAPPGPDDGKCLP